MKKTYQAAAGFQPAATRRHVSDVHGTLQTCRRLLAGCKPARALTIAFALLISLTSSAKLHESLRRQATNTDALAFYDAMDAYEAANPDATTDFTYDCYPDGRKIVGRRASSDGMDSPGNYLNEIVAVFDSIVFLPNKNRLVVQNIDNSTFLRAYKMRTEDEDFTIDTRELAGQTTSALIQRTRGAVIVAQNWATDTGQEYGAPDLSALRQEFTRLSKLPKTTSVHENTSEEINTGGGYLRRRDIIRNNNRIDGDIVTIKDISVKDWINLHHLFMDYVGADGDMSLTYRRNYRSVTLTDMATHTIYFARYRPTTDKTGTLTLFVGTYTGDPFLPNIL